MGEIFLRVLVHLDTDFLISIMFELRFTKYGIFQEAIVNPFKISLDASLSQIMGNMMVFSFFSLPISVAMRSLLLNDIILNSKKVQCPLKDASAGFTFFQEVPVSAINDALVPLKKAFFALHFRNCLAQLK